MRLGIHHSYLLQLVPKGARGTMIRSLSGICND